MKKILITLSTLLLLNTSISYAQSSSENITKICNINISEKEISDAYLLFNHKYNVPILNINTNMEEITEVYKEDVENAVYYLFSQLQKEGINIKEFAPKNINLSIVKANVLESVLAHAFVYLPEDIDIYLYYKTKNLWATNQTESTVVHEIGHYVDTKYLSYEDRQEYLKIRNLSGDWYNSNEEWGARPVEMFAEDFKMIFDDHLRTEKYAYHKIKRFESDEQKEKIKNLIITAIKKTQAEEVNDKYQLLVENSIIDNFHYFTCDELLKNSILNQDISKETFKDSLVRYMKQNYKEIFNEKEFDNKIRDLKTTTYVNYDSKNPLTYQEAQILFLTLTPYLVSSGHYTYDNLLLPIDKDNANKTMQYKEAYDLLINVLKKEYSKEIKEIENPNIIYKDIQEEELINKAQVLQQKGILTPSDYFYPDNDLKKEEAVAIIIRMLGADKINSYLTTKQNVYRDIDYYKWMGNYIFIAKNYNLLPSEEYFGYQRSITFNEFFNIITKTKKFNNETINLIKSSYNLEENIKRKDILNILNYLIE